MVVTGAKTPASGSDFSIGIAKNRTIILAPILSMAPVVNNHLFQIILNTEVALTSNDYVEVFISSNNCNTKTLVFDECN